MLKPIAFAVNEVLERPVRAAQPLPASLPVCAADTPPVRIDRICDIDIPRRLWSAIKLDDRPRAIIRALTEAERVAIEQRYGDLVSALVPYTGAQTNDVALAISDMASGFRSATRGYDEESAVAMIDGIRRMLKPLPAWAIKEGCHAIQRGQAGLDHKFLPNDNEIYEVIDRLARPYRERLRECEALLNAPVEHTNNETSQKQGEG